MVNEKSSAVGVNIQEKATMIWNVADVLRGPFKPHEYGLVILPMTVVKRFHDCLLPTHDAVIEQYEKVKKLAVIDGFLTRASGYQFYNTSRFTFESLLADPDNIEANFRDYLAGFSGNVQDVLAKFDFDNIIAVWWSATACIWSSRSSTPPRATSVRIRSAPWTAAISLRISSSAFPSPLARRPERTSPAGTSSI